MFSQADIDQLLAAMRANGVTRLDVRRDNRQFRLDLPASAVAGTRPAEPASVASTTLVQSPGIGRFLPRGGDDGLPVLETGAGITEGEVLGYLCQGAARLVVAAPTGGRLPGAVPDAGALVGYGDTLFTLEPKQ